MATESVERGEQLRPLVLLPTLHLYILAQWLATLGETNHGRLLCFEPETRGLVLLGGDAVVGTIDRRDRKPRYIGVISKAGSIFIY